MTIEIQPLEKEDLVPWLEIHYEAFYPTFPFFWYRRPSPESFQAMAERRVDSLAQPENHFMKAVDTEQGNKVVGVASWSVHTEQRTEQDTKKSFTAPMTIPEINEEARNAFTAQINEARMNIMGPAPVVMLNSLVVSPSYQRKGIGAQLMKFGVDEADRLGLRAYLEASVFGKGLYERFGYKDVKNIEFDCKPWGGEGIDVHTVMIRDPKPLEKS